MSNVQHRRGFSLLELIIVVAIVLLLIALILPAIQMVRSTASRMQSTNNLKQIGLALHQHNDAKGRFPGVNNARKITTVDFRFLEFDNDPNADYPPMLQLIPFMEAKLRPEDGYPPLKVLTGPADPTFPSHWPDETSKLGVIQGPCSYGLNMSALEGRPNLANGFPDGTGQTIAATERYFTSYMLSDTTVAHSGAEYQTGTSYSEVIPGTQEDGFYSPSRRASFADAGYRGEVIPITRTVNGQSVTRPSVPGQTFQVRPKVDSAWSGVPQTPYASGLPTLFFDGSVRTINSGVDPSVFWGAVTRNGGEVLTDW